MWSLSTPALMSMFLNPQNLQPLEYAKLWWARKFLKDDNWLLFLNNEKSSWIQNKIVMNWCCWFSRISNWSEWFVVNGFALVLTFLHHKNKINRKYIHMVSLQAVWVLFICLSNDQQILLRTCL
jgi:hypothetical protein